MFEPLVVVLVLLAGFPHRWCRFNRMNRVFAVILVRLNQPYSKVDCIGNLPYPFGRIDRIVANRIHQMSIGHEEEEGDEL